MGVVLKTWGHWGNCTKLLWACSVHCPWWALLSTSCNLGRLQPLSRDHSQASLAILCGNMLVLSGGPVRSFLSPKTVYMHSMQMSFLLIYKIHFSNPLMDWASCVSQPELSLPESTRFKCFHLLLAVINIKTSTEATASGGSSSFKPVPKSLGSSCVPQPYRRCPTLMLIKHPTNSALHGCPHLFHWSWHWVPDPRWHLPTVHQSHTGWAHRMSHTGWATQDEHTGWWQPCHFQLSDPKLILHHFLLFNL